jgi:hypothetical protein
MLNKKIVYFEYYLSKYHRFNNSRWFCSYRIKKSASGILEYIYFFMFKNLKVWYILLLRYNKYEQAGVREYWIVEPEGKFISVFTLQENIRYGRPDIYTDENKIRVGIFDDFIIDLKTVFD